tara:strand:+ start:40656 stop:41429 length:774 start_codon:yes stop_codon:yes gene_type:complete
MQKSLQLLFILFLFSSCAFHSGMMTGNASLTDANFQVVQLAVGHSKTVHIIGLGGLKSDAIVFEAKQDLLRNYPLKQGQVLANVSVDFKRSFYFVVGVTKVTVTADVVEFIKPTTGLLYDGIYYENLDLRDSTFVGFNLNDSVYAVVSGNIKKAKIIGLTNSKIKVSYKHQNYLVQNKVWPNNVLRNASSPDNIELYDFDVTDNVKATLGNGDIVNGVIFGINRNQAGVKYNFDHEGNFNWALVPLAKLIKLEVAPK